MNIKTSKLPNGEWMAIDADTYDGASPIAGYGKDIIAARDDLRRQMIDIDDVEWEIEGCSMNDDHVDAYFVECFWKDSGRPLTDDEMDFLTNNYGDVIETHCFEESVCAAENAYDLMMER